MNWALVTWPEEGIKIFSNMELTNHLDGYDLRQHDAYVISL